MRSVCLLYMTCTTCAPSEESQNPDNVSQRKKAGEILELCNYLERVHSVCSLCMCFFRRVSAKTFCGWLELCKVTGILLRRICESQTPPIPDNKSNLTLGFGEDEDDIGKLKGNNNEKGCYFTLHSFQVNHVVFAWLL